MKSPLKQCRISNIIQGKMTVVSLQDWYKYNHFFTITLRNNYVIDIILNTSSRKKDYKS